MKTIIFYTYIFFLISVCELLLFILLDNGFDVQKKNDGLDVQIKKTKQMTRTAFKLINNLRKFNYLFIYVF